MRKSCKWRGIVMTALICFTTLAQAQCAVYPLPEEIARSGACTVTVDGVAIPVMDTAVNLTRTWTSRPITTTAPVAWLTLAGSVRVSVRFPNQSLQSAVVRPLSLGITPVVAGDTVCFTLDTPAALTVEVNGGQAGALHLFADAPEADVPTGENVMVFQPVYTMPER